jgi:Xaa-Pro aminopeptidase
VLDGRILVNQPRLARALEHADVDAVIATSPANVAYLSDYESLMHPLVPSLPGLVVYLAGDEPDPVLVTSSIGVDEWAELRPWFDEIRLYGPPNRELGRELLADRAGLLPESVGILEQGLETEHPSGLVEVVADVLRDRGLDGSRVAIDENGLPGALREQIEASVPGCHFVEGSALLGWVRMVKTEPEIEALAEAALMSCDALDEARDVAAAGATERDLWRAYSAAVAMRGGEFTFMTVGAGERSALIHPSATDYVLRDGDIIKYDVGLRFRRYHADTARTQAVGAPSEERDRAHEAVARGQAAAVEAVAPGVSPAEIFEIAVEGVREHGIPDYRRHHVGHGIGIELYDPPSIGPSAASHGFAGQTDDRLEPGMVLNIETPFYGLGEYGLQMEDTVVVTDDGYRVLTPAVRSLVWER